MPIKTLYPSEAALTNLGKLPDTLAGEAGATTKWEIPGPLQDFLKGLQRLEDVPFANLVADPEQLPPESLRFFYLDPNWQRALLEGALSAASSGTADDDDRLDGFRKAVLDDLAATRSGGPTETVTGMLLRSAIVRYHPKLIVRAKDGATRLTTLRQERLSQSILIVLWKGRPTRVELEEPRTSTWFGIDGVSSGKGYVERKDDNGVGVVKPPPAPAPQRPNIDVVFRADAAGRQVIDVARLADAVKTGTGWAAVDSAGIALQMQQQPYCQVFEGTSDKGTSGPRNVLADFDLVDFVTIARNALQNNR